MKLTPSDEESTDEESSQDETNSDEESTDEESSQDETNSDEESTNIEFPNLEEETDNETPSDKEDSQDHLKFLLKYIDQTTIDPNHLQLRYDTSNNLSIFEKNAFQHIATIESYFEDTYNYKSERFLKVYVNSKKAQQILNGCGSYYNPMDSELHLGQGGCNLKNQALSEQIIYHEYTHHIMDQIFAIPATPGTESGAINEGISDFFASSLTDNPLFGQDFVISPRNLDNTKHTDDWTNSNHRNSLIFTGALWDLRSIIGAEQTEKIVFKSLFAGRRTLEEFMYQMIIEDDDDNDITNGTPNLAAILLSFDYHGIGPGIMGWVGEIEFSNDLLELFKQKNLLLATDINVTISSTTINFGSFDDSVKTAPDVTTVTINTDSPYTVVRVRSDGIAGHYGLINEDDNSIFIPTAPSSDIKNTNSSAAYGIYADNCGSHATVHENFDNDGISDTKLNQELQTLMTVSNPSGVTSCDIHYKAKSNYSIPPGNYSDQITFNIYTRFP